MSEPSAADREIVATADRLQALRSRLGSEYWQDEEVIGLQDTLRRQIAAYNAWAEEALPMHQRARAAARWESRFASLLWPGRADD